ncbi:MAG: hypothetical protein IIC67_04800 [Thaumarchaeota archaeon]|nr:hypothetical protein [Nitrososphaerota archaeon]
MANHKRTPLSSERANIPRDSTLLQICAYLQNCGQTGAIKTNIKTNGTKSSMSSSDVNRNIRLLLYKEWISSKTVEEDRDGIPNAETKFKITDNGMEALSKAREAKETELGKLDVFKDI